MNWKLIFQLSLFGLAMGVLTIWVSGGIEGLLWLAIFLFCAYVIAKRCASGYFLTGFMIGIFNSVWVTACHVIAHEVYMANHSQEAEMMTTMPMPDSPRLMMTFTGPIIGVVSGIILGLFAVIASKIVRKG